MPNPTGIIGFSPSTPAAPSGRQNTKPQGDGSSPLEHFSFNFPNIGGVSYASGTGATLGQSQQGILTDFTGGSSVAVTLNNPTDSGYYTFVTVSGAGTVTITPASGTINGASALVLASGLSALIFWDSSNWVALLMNTGGGGGAPTNALYVVGTPNSYLTSAAAVPGVYYSPDAQPASAGSLDDEFNGSSLNTSTRWTWLNQLTATANVSNSICGLRQPAPGGASNNTSWIYQTAPSTPWAVVAKISLTAPNINNASGGLMVYDSVGGRLIAWGMGCNSNNIEFINNRYSSSTTFSSSHAGWTNFNQSWVYFKLEDDGTNLLMSVSFDGANFVLFDKESRTAYLTNGPDSVGLFVSNSVSSGGPDSNGYDAVLSCEWFRRVL